MSKRFIVVIREQDKADRYLFSITPHLRSCENIEAAMIFPTFKEANTAAKLHGPSATAMLKPAVADPIAAKAAADLGLPPDERPPVVTVRDQPRDWLVKAGDRFYVEANGFFSWSTDVTKAQRYTKAEASAEAKRWAGGIAIRESDMAPGPADFVEAAAKPVRRAEPTPSKIVVTLKIEFDDIGSFVDGDMNELIGKAREYGGCEETDITVTIGGVTVPYRK